MLDQLGPGPVTPRAPLAGLSRTAKIGALLQDFGRGVAGKKSYTQELMEERAQQEAIELERTNVGISAMTKGMELLKNTPAGQREAVAKQFGQLYEHLLPGFTETLSLASQQPEATEEQMRALGEHADTLVKIGGSLDGALKLAQNPAFMKQLNDASDSRNAPEIVSALERGKTLMEQTPETKALWDEMTKDGLTISDLQNPTFRDALGLTQGHVNTIMRSPEIQSNLRPFGFMPTADLDAQAKIDRDKKAEGDKVGQAAAIARAETEAREGAKMITFIGPDNTILRKPQREADALRAQGFQPLVTGRTEADASAIQEAQEKDQAGKAVPVDPYFARITGLDPATTVQEAIDQGLTPDIDDTTKRALQGGESAVRGVQTLVSQMREIVKTNPNANTLVAQLGGLVTNVRSELEALAASTGVKIDVDRELKGREGIFKTNGIDNALMKQLAIGLAYMNAKQLDENGRLSDADVRNAAKALGAGASNPDILVSLLDQTEMTADDNFRNRVQSVTGARRESTLPDVQAAEAIQRRADAGETITPEEIQARTPRALRHLQSLRSKARQ